MVLLLLLLWYCCCCCCCCHRRRHCRRYWCWCCCWFDGDSIRTIVSDDRYQSVSVDLTSKVSNQTTKPLYHFHFLSYCCIIFRMGDLPAWSSHCLSLMFYFCYFLSILLHFWRRRLFYPFLFIRDDASVRLLLHPLIVVDAAFGTRVILAVVSDALLFYYVCCCILFRTDWSISCVGCLSERPNSFLLPPHPLPIFVDSYACRCILSHTVDRTRGQACCCILSNTTYFFILH